MIKRIISTLLSVAIISSLGVLVMPAKAVTPYEGLVASALISFVGASGARLWRDGGVTEPEGLSTMISDVKTLWGDFVSGLDNTPPTWDSVISNPNNVSVTDGRFILNYDTAQTFQSFTDWLSNYHKFKPWLEYSLNSKPPSYGYPDKNVFAIKLNFSEVVNYEYNGTKIAYADRFVYYRTSNDIDYFLGLSFDAGENAKNFYIAHAVNPNNNQNGLYLYVPEMPSNSSKFTMVLYTVNEEIELNTRYYVFSVSSPGWRFITSYPNTGEWTFPESNYYDFISSSSPPVSMEEDGGLIASVGGSIADLVYNLAKPIEDDGDIIYPGQDLAIDIGVGTTSDADDLVSDVVSRYINDSIVDTQPLATPVPVEGATELYPQPEIGEIIVDGETISFTDLGPMLTERFPFCLPWDLQLLFNTIIVPAKPIKTRIDIIPAEWKTDFAITGDTSFDLDLTTDEFLLLRKLIAFGFLFGTCGQLILLTKHFVTVT